MATRLDYTQASPNVFKAMLHLENVVRASGLEPRILHLVKLRASYLNSCAYCIHMHTGELLAEGMAAQDAALVAAWHEAPSRFSEREQAALAWTDALTNLIESHAPDDAYEQVRVQFNDKELADLTLAIATINAWNRFGVGFRLEPPAS